MCVPFQVVTPKYLSHSTMVTGIALIVIDNSEFWCVETFRSELFVRVIERPDDVIQLDIRSTSSWKVSWLVQRGRYSKMSSA